MMERFLFRCKECGFVFEIEAASKDHALHILSGWRVCSFGKHPVLISMRESSEDYVPED